MKEKCCEMCIEEYMEDIDTNDLIPLNPPQCGNDLCSCHKPKTS